MGDLIIRIDGLDLLIRKLDPAMAAGPARRYFHRGTLIVQRAARQKTPIDTGRLVDSITTEIDSALLPEWGVIGTNVEYAPYVENDTMPHMPPVAPLEAWAARHGSPGSGFAIAVGISRYGTEGHHMLRDGLHESADAINALVPVFAAEIEREAAG